MKRNLLNLLVLLFSIIVLFSSTSAQNEELRLEVQNGHSGGALVSVAVSPDGKFALTGSMDWTALLWDLESGQQIRRFSGHNNFITSTSFSGDGKYILTSSMDRTARLWEVATGKQIRIFAGGLFSTGIISANITKNSKFVVTGDEDQRIRLWDALSGKELFSMTLPGKINSVIFSPDDRFILVGCADKIARLYESQTGIFIRQFVKHTGEIRAIAFSPDSRQILTGSDDKTVNLWNVEKDELEKTFEVGNPLLNVKFMPNGNSGVFGIRDETANSNQKAAEIWDLAKGKKISELPSQNQGLSLAITPNGEEILIVSGRRLDKKVHIFGSGSGKEKREIRGFSDLVAYVDVSTDIKNIITGSNYTISDNKSASDLQPNNNISSAFWDLVKGTKLDWWQQTQKVAKTSETKVREFVGISPNNRYLLVGKGNQVEIISAINGKQILLINGKTPDDQFTSASFSPDSKLLVIGGTQNGADKQKFYLNQLWEIETKTQIKQFAGHENEINSVIFSPDGKAIASAGNDGTLRIWNLDTGEATQVIKDISSIIGGIAFSPDGSVIATAGSDNSGSLIKARRNSVRGWEVKTGNELFSFQGDFDILSNQSSGFRSVSFSPDGKYLAAGNIDGKIFLWDMLSQKISKKIIGHHDSVYALKFSADGKYLISGSNDATTRIWNRTTDEEICKLISFSDGSWAVIDKFGRYDASNGGEIEGIHWVYGMETIALRQLKDIYYTPNLLSRLLGYNKEPMRTVPDLKDLKLFPKITEQKLDEANARLTVKLKNRGGGIGQVRILVNGKLAAEDARSEKLKATPNIAEAIVTFDLKESAGFNPKDKNKIEVITNNYDPTTKKSYISSKGDVIYLGNLDEQLKPPTLYAIIGGVSDYNGDLIDLKFAAKDAEDFANALSIGARRLFCPKENPNCNDRVKIKLLTTSGKEGTQLPTKANFKNAFAEVAKEAKPEDILVIYLSGHGASLTIDNTDNYFYLTQEADAASKEVLGKKEYRDFATISSNELLNWLTQEKWVAGQKGVKAMKQLMILDTCAAGAFEQKASLQKSKDLSSDQIRALERLKDRTGFYVLMGSAADAVSYEASRYGQGLLTYSLLEAMKGAALRERQYADVNQIFGYAVERVPAMAKDNGGIQKPRIFAPHQSQSFDFGQFTPKEQKSFNLANVKPLILRPNLQNEQLRFDNLRLTALMAKAFVKESYVEVRGDSVPPIVFVDVDEMFDAITPSGRYEIVGETINLELVLVRNNLKIGEVLKITGNLNDLDKFVKNVVDTVVREAQKL